MVRRIVNEIRERLGTRIDYLFGGLSLVTGAFGATQRSTKVTKLTKTCVAPKAP
jgi:hypothetical protein